MEKGKRSMGEHNNSRECVVTEVRISNEEYIRVYKKGEEIV